MTARTKINSYAARGLAFIASHRTTCSFAILRPTDLAVLPFFRSSGQKQNMYAQQRTFVVFERARWGSGKQSDFTAAGDMFWRDPCPTQSARKCYSRPKSRHTS